LPKDIEAVPGLALLVSCSDDKQGQEHLGPLERHGVFYEFVIRGLMGAAGNDSSKVTVGELYEYLVKTVPAYTTKGFGTAQEPRWLDNPKATSKDVVLVQRKGLLNAVYRGYRGLVAREKGDLKTALDALTEAEKDGAAYFPELFTLRAAVNYQLA